jgi:microcystin degradation protein MlrC
VNRRTFIKGASLAVLAAPAVRVFGASSKRIAFGGIQIECSTYGDTLSRMEDFTVVRGDDLAASRRFAFLKSYPHPFMPTLVASAVPGGRVERKTYDALKAEFLDRLRKLLPLDGLYLPMHGAMFVEGMFDAEGDWIAAAREVVGPDCLVSASYDLHGNVSQRVVDQLDAFSAFRTAPHIDREETFRRACDMLVNGLDRGVRPSIVWAPVPVLMPGERSSTEYEPAKRLWAQLPALDKKPGVLDASLMVGYVWADEPRATACSVVTGTDQAALHDVARDLAQQYWDARREFAFGVPTGTMAEVLDRALKLDTKPVVLSDSGDNPTGGGTGDRADALAELIRKRVKNAVVAGIADRPATLACYEAGVGATVTLKVGGTLDPARSTPIDVTGKVIFLAPTENVAERQAVIDIDGISLVLTARRRPFHRPEDFTSLGLQPSSFKIVVVKAGYLVPEIAAFANPNLMALTDGAVNQDIPRLTSQHRVPTFPWKQDLTFTPATRASARAGKK